MKGRVAEKIRAVDRQYLFNDELSLVESLPRGKLRLLLFSLIHFSFVLFRLGRLKIDTLLDLFKILPFKLFKDLDFLDINRFIFLPFAPGKVENLSWLVLQSKMLNIISRSKMAFVLLRLP